MEIIGTVSIFTCQEKQSIIEQITKMILRKEKMMATQKYTQFPCQGCGNRCFLEIQYDTNAIQSVKGNRCDGGKRYAAQQLLRDKISVCLPTIDGRQARVVSTEPIPLQYYTACLEQLAQLVLETPVCKGETIWEDWKTGICVVADENLF